MLRLCKRIYDNWMRIRRLELIAVEMLEMIREKGEELPIYVDKAEDYLLYEDDEDYKGTWKTIFAWSEEKAQEEFDNQDELGPEEEWEDEEDD